MRGTWASGTRRLIVAKTPLLARSPKCTAASLSRTSMENLPASQRRGLYRTATSTVLYYCALRGVPTSSLRLPYSVPSSPSLVKSPAKGSSTPYGVNPSYMEAQLKDEEAHGYRSAGLLPVAFFTVPPPGSLTRGATISEVDFNEGIQEAEEHAVKESSPNESEHKAVPYILLGSELRAVNSTLRDQGMSHALNVLGSASIRTTLVR